MKVEENITVSTCLCSGFVGAEVGRGLELSLLDLRKQITEMLLIDPSAASSVHGKVGGLQSCAYLAEH